VGIPILLTKPYDHAMLVFVILCDFLWLRSKGPDRMKRVSCLAIVAFCLSTSAAVFGAEQPSLDPRLEPLRPLVGKTWKGAFKNSTSENPVVDVARWERALNGKAVRLLHSINDGAYGGETIFMWDEKKQAVGYHYFTTAGFMTTGSVSFEDGKLTTHEVVTGSAGGVSEVRGTTELLPDGTFHIKTEYLKNGKWEPGRETTYHEDSTAEVVFK
jgi:hypothetical protein